MRKIGCLNHSSKAVGVFMWICGHFDFFVVSLGLGSDAWKLKTIVNTWTFDWIQRTIWSLIVYILLIREIIYSKIWHFYKNLQNNVAVFIQACLLFCYYNWREFDNCLYTILLLKILPIFFKLHIIT